MRQGDIFVVHFPPPIGSGPAVVLTRTSAARKLSGVTVVPLTTVVRGIPSEVVVSSSSGPSVDSIANLDNILTIPRSMMADRIGHVSEGELLEILSAIHYVFDMPF